MEAVVRKSESAGIQGSAGAAKQRRRRRGQGVVTQLDVEWILCMQGFGRRRGFDGRERERQSRVRKIGEEGGGRKVDCCASHWTLVCHFCNTTLVCHSPAAA